MQIQIACLWGLVGVAMVEAYQLWLLLRPARSPRWPWLDGRGRPRILGYVIAVVCRCAMAIGLNAVYASSHQVAGPLGAATLGIAAPLIIQQMAVRADAPESTESGERRAS